MLGYCAVQLEAIWGTQLTIEVTLRVGSDSSLGCAWNFLFPNLFASLLAVLGLEGSSNQNSGLESG